jgi:ADP-ribose pyrophosphatase YjhB (NUDIX family)
MKFCSICAHPVTIEVPPDDHLPRHVCRKCGVVHYQNPRLVICTIPTWEENGETKILLCKRAIDPRHGYWTLPGGFMENDETTTQAAMRETIEEAGAHVEMLPLFSLINLPAFHQVHLFYRAALLDLEFTPGQESLEVRIFSESEIPWEQIAFATVTQALKFFFADLIKVRKGGIFGFHSYDISGPGYPGG